jgi:hypothetical protein
MIDIITSLGFATGIILLHFFKRKLEKRSQCRIVRNVGQDFILLYKNLQQQHS